MNRIMQSVLDAEYVIDGVKMELSPREILDDAVGKSARNADALKVEPVVDETVDPDPAGVMPELQVAENLILGSLPNVAESRKIPSFCADSMTCAEIAKALTEVIWREGHFRSGDLEVSILWEWDMAPVGSMAAFYYSVEAACDYLDMLGVRLAGYDFRECTGGCSVKVSVNVSEGARMEEDDEEPENPLPFCEVPFKTESPALGEGRRCPAVLSGEKDNWLIYIPFDTGKFRLGGSLLSSLSGISGGKAPDDIDSDYFLDCYEVVREFVEDGVVLSGVTVGEGGLFAALATMTGSGVRGMDIDISGIMKSYGEQSQVNVLFGEVPGALIEIKDIDFDYVDAEMLLQDVAYYPIGHPAEKGLNITGNSATGVSGILRALLAQRDAPEGED